ncbi:MAG TPA: methyltransferase, partial [Chitinophagaceae bacterium]|nr:methyltransferase [Chitinophagaceae bacterium]
MSNNYFRFKQFTIHQDKCAMKVCTDACLFGSLITQFLISNHNLLHVLDIGAGTGLLSLMYAQKNSAAIIHAVEIDEGAAQQAIENFTVSPWKERLELHNTSIQQFSNTVIQQYNLIISNPPFFENDLKSGNHKRNLALHSSELSFEELLEAISKLLAADGVFAVLVPYHRADEMLELAAAKNLFLMHHINVKQ